MQRYIRYYIYCGKIIYFTIKKLTITIRQDCNYIFNKLKT